MYTRRNFLKTAAVGTGVILVPKGGVAVAKTGLERPRIRPGASAAGVQALLAEQAIWVAQHPFYAGQSLGLDSGGNLLINTESGEVATAAVNSSSIIWLNGAEGSAQDISAGDKLYVAADATAGGTPIVSQAWVNLGWVKGVVLAINGFDMTVQTRYRGQQTATLTAATEIHGVLPWQGGYADFLGYQPPGTGSVIAQKVFASAA